MRVLAFLNLKMKSFLFRGSKKQQQCSVIQVKGNSFIDVFMSKLAGRCWWLRIVCHVRVDQRVSLCEASLRQEGPEVCSPDNMELEANAKEIKHFWVYWSSSPIWRRLLSWIRWLLGPLSHTGHGHLPSSEQSGYDTDSPLSPALPRAP